MNDNFTIQQLLDDVVQHNVNRKVAEQSLATLGIENPALEIEAHLAAAKAIQRHNIIQQVQSVHQRFVQEQTTTAEKEEKAPVVSIRPIKFLLRIAAAAILIMGVFIGYEYTNTNSSKIYSTVYQTYELNTSRSVTEEIPTHQMLEQYRRKDYTAVINTFKSLSTTNNREKFLTAYAYHETQKYDEAIHLYQQILQYNQENESQLYNDEAEFYVGLSYLKLKNIEKSLLYFEPIATDPNHTFHNRFNRWTLVKLKWLK